MKRVRMGALPYLRSAFPARWDLIFTSPPAYPSGSQLAGSLGTEPNLGEYVDHLGRILFQCRRVLRAGGFLVLVIEPIPGFDVMGALQHRLRRILMPLMATFRWNHGENSASWVVILGKGRQAALNRAAPAWSSREWAIPRPPPDAGYGFYEWPAELVQAVLDLTLPYGGRILDPFAGKARALGRLGPEFEVTAVDVLDDDEIASPDESRMVALANQIRSWGQRTIGNDEGDA